MMAVGQITGETIKSAISLKIRSAFATSSGTPPVTLYPTIYKEKVVQGMVKPCVFVWTMDVSPVKRMNNSFELPYQMNIRYEPSEGDEEKYKSCMNAAMTLIEALSSINVPIDVDGEEVLKQVYGRNMEFSITDDVLQFFASYTLRGYVPEAATQPLMETLDIVNQ
jgi:hypothetical protein